MKPLAALVGAATALAAMVAIYEVTCFSINGQKWIAAALDCDDPTPSHE